MALARKAAAASQTAEQLELLRIYSAYRTSLLNVKYYGYKLKWSTRINTTAEVIIAIATAGGVSGWAIWNTTGGAPIWSALAGVSALLAAIKPVLPLSRNISRYSQLYGGHNSNYLAMKDLVDRIPIEGGLTQESEREFGQISKRHREMASQDDPYPSRKLVARFTAEVNTQIPPTSLWCPAE